MEKQISQSHKMMVFVLSMSVYGLATLFSELIPSFQVGIVEFSVEYLLFIPLTLAMLFDPLTVALGAATGELVFSEIMLGQFGGLGELEKFITVTIGIWLAGSLVRNVKKPREVAFAAMLGVFVQQALGMLVDVLKVKFAIEEFEAVAGLPQSVWFTEGFAFVNDLLFSGILFCLLPTLYFAPKLYGKIEPLMGLKPRDEKQSFSLSITPVKLLIAGVAALFAFVFEFAAESGFSLIDWEAEWAESNLSFIIAISIASVIAVYTIIATRKKRNA